jgi:RND family efflux transporter MFP subunit
MTVERAIRMLAGSLVLLSSRWLGPWWLILAGAALLAGCGAHHSTSPTAVSPPLLVQVDRAHVIGTALCEEVVGTVRARTSASIAPTVMGRIDEMPVKLGQHLHAGDVVARVSAAEITARVDQARAVESRARTDFDRAKRLFDDGAISSAQFEVAQSELAVARGSLAEASALESHTVLRAPFAGVVTSKIANVGDTAVPGQPLLVLENPTSLRFEAMVPEASTHELATGRGLPVRIDGLTGALEGPVAEISPVADPTSRTVLVKIDLPTDPRLHAGLFGRLSIVTRHSQAIAVPANALVRHGQLEEIFVVDRNVARLRLVRTGHERDGSVEIVSGLTEGELVAVSEVGELTDGRPVEVVP